MTNVESTRALREQAGPGRRLLRALGLSAASSPPATSTSTTGTVAIRRRLTPRSRSGSASPEGGPAHWDCRAMIELDDLTFDSPTTPLPDHEPEDESDDSYTSDLHSLSDIIGWSSAGPHWVTKTPTPFGPRSALHRRTTSLASIVSTSSTSSSPQTPHDIDGPEAASLIHRHTTALPRQPSRHHARKSQEACRVWRDYW